MRLTKELAMEAGRDAANRQMRAAGRVKWSKEDYQLAVQTYETLVPLLEQLAEQAARED